MNIVLSNALPKEIELAISSANVFFSKEYANLLSNKGEQLYYVFDEERIIPVRYRHKFIFSWTVLLSEPFTYGDSPVLSLEAFLDNAIRLLERKLKSMWTISTASGFFLDTPRVNCLRIPFGSHVIDLSQQQEKIWSSIHSKHKNVIRKAEKENVVIKHGGKELLPDFLLLDSETWKRSESNSPGEKYYSQQLDCLKDKIAIYIAYHNQIPQAGAIFFYNNAMCYYMYGNSADKSFTGSANLLQWKAIVDMKNLGVKRFSFVGCRINEDPNSKYHGIQRFKSRFGGTLETGYLFRVVSRPMFYKLFCKGMQIRSKSKQPYKDAIDEEINKWLDIQK